MGRPRIYLEKRVRTTIALPQTLKTRLDEVAADRMVAFNLIVERALIEWLDNVPDIEQSLQGRQPGATVRSMADRRLGG